MPPATLNLDLEPGPSASHDPTAAAYVPLVRFEAFLPAQRLSGWVRLAADRLTDLLNSHDLLHLTNVLVEDDRGGGMVAADETLIPRSEIIAVIASGRRGDPARRQETARHPMIVETGPYRIGGFVHAPIGVDPRDRLYIGGPMVPLTEAWLEHRTDEGALRETCETVIINRQHMSSVEMVDHASVNAVPHH